MEVKAVLWFWTPGGMKSGAGEYVARRDAERLLEEAHERGRQVGLEQAREVLRKEVA